MKATATGTFGIKSYDWNADPQLSCLSCPNPIAICDSSTDFVVRATDSINCIEFDTVRVVVKRDFLYFIPTAFTPNADGLNDYFEVNILGAKQIDMQIFNRWGEVVYTNDNMPNGSIGTPCTSCWNGTWRDKPAQYDTYTFQLEVLLYGETEKRKLAGTVNLMR